MMVKKLKKAIVSVVIMALILPLFTNIVQAAEVNWDITKGKTAFLGVQFQQPNNRKYYKVNERAIYRTYLSDSASGNTKDYTKNLFCLDMNGYFPTETTEGVTNAAASYTSQGPLSTDSTVTLSSRSSSKVLSGSEVQKIMAIIHSARQGLNQSTLAAWLDAVIAASSKADDEATGAEIIRDYNYSIDDVQVAVQIAIWEVTNGLTTATLKESTTENGSFNQNSNEPVNNMNTYILSYLRNKAANASSSLPATVTPSFASTTKTTKVINGKVYVGPFKINNPTSIKSAKVYTVNSSGTETEVTGYTVYNGNTATSGTFQTIKQAGTNNFYIAIPKTEASGKTKLKIKLTADTVTYTLWTNPTSNTAQPLISYSTEPHETEDEGPIVIPTYDVALRKYITKVNGTAVSNSRQPTVKPQTSGKNAGDFRYEHRKDPILVKPGDKVTYAIRVYNESENAVTVKGITDYLPTGLILDTNASTGWTASSGKAVYSGNISLPGKTGNTPTTPSNPIEVTCTVGADVTSDRILTNVAEITNLVDADGYELKIVPDGLEEDSQYNNLTNTTKSCPDNYTGDSGNNNDLTKSDYFFGEEDDDDFEKVKVQIEGSYNVKLQKTDKSGNVIKTKNAKFKVKDGNNAEQEKTTTNGEIVIVSGKTITSTTTQDIYTIEETEAPEGYTLLDKTLTLTVYKKQQDGKYSIDRWTLKDESGNDVADTDAVVSSDGTTITVKVKDTLEDGYNLNLIKIDASGKTINNNEAEFEIQEDTIKKSTTTNGQISIAENKKINNTTPDTYIIEETKAPSGYNKAEGKFKVTVEKEETTSGYGIKDVIVEELNSDGTSKTPPSTVTIATGETKTLGGIVADMNENIITVKVKNTKEIIDLALRKYIATVNGQNKQRDPNTSPNSIDISPLTDDNTETTTAKYNHPKTPVEVNVGDVIVYTIKVYNEGATDAYAREVSDYIPEGLGYLINHQTNVENRWGIADPDAATIVKYKELPQSLLTKIGNKITASDFLKDDGTTRETSLDNVNVALGKLEIKSRKLEQEKIPAFNKDATLDADKLQYKTLQVACVVLNKEAYTAISQTPGFSDGDILTNISAVTEYGDKDNNKIESDVDSDPEEIDQDNYTNEQDDDDYDPVKYKDQVFDLSLKKFITKVKTPKSDGTFIEKDYSRVKKEDGSTLQSSDDADFDLDKTVVKVRTGDTVVYTIRVYNEGEIDGYATKIADSVPEGLEFVTYSVDNDGNFISGSRINYENGWKIIVNPNTSGWKTGVETEILKDKKISAYDRTNNRLSSRDVQIEFKVIGTEPKEIKNWAEITDDSDKDRDSDPGNEDEKEDDIDYDVIIPQKFDLALQKFITDVSGKAITDRKPVLKYENGKITYTHTTDPYIVVQDNLVTYTIRLYNEGDLAGFPKIVKDDLPKGITYLPDSSTNKKYEWKMYKKVKDGEDTSGKTVVEFETQKYIEVDKVADADTIATDYYSYEKATKRGEKAIEPFDSTKDISDSNPDYRDLQVQFKVTESDPDAQEKIIINTAEISEDQDENGNDIKDIDSTPDNDKENEDDIDKEYLKLKYFDLSLLKYVSSVEVTEDGKKKVQETGYDGTENPEPIVKIEINKNKLKKTKIKYTYSIKVTNEGQIEGYAKEITDYIPSGLEFYAEDNKEYNWKKDGNGKVKTDYLKDTLLKPGESAIIKLVLRWKNGSNNLGLKTNVAEISIDDNEYNAPDIDSTPDNKVETEDDQDDALVILSIKTGSTQIYIILILTILAVLSVGGFTIYKYVYKPSNISLVEKKKYSHRRR